MLPIYTMAFSITTTYNHQKSLLFTYVTQLFQLIIQRVVLFFQANLTTLFYYSGGEFPKSAATYLTIYFVGSRRTRCFGLFNRFFKIILHTISEALYCNLGVEFRKVFYKWLPSLYKESSREMSSF